MILTEAGFRIRIRFTDPDPCPAFEMNTDPDPAFLMNTCPDPDPGLNFSPEFIQKFIFLFPFLIFV